MPNSPVIHTNACCVPKETLYLNVFNMNFSGFAAGTKTHLRAVKQFVLRCPNSSFFPFFFGDPSP